MTIIAYDFETHAFAAGYQIPDAVCMSYAVIGMSAVAPGGCRIEQADVVTAAVGIEYLRQWLTAGCYMVGAETAFDVLVSIRSAPDPQEMLALWVTAYQQDRVTDVLLRQKLIDLACSYRRPKYSLASVIERHHPTLRLDKSDDRIKHIRVSYGALDGKPISEYPKDYYDYSLEDSVATAHAWIGQELSRAKGSAYFPGADVVHNQHEQARTALAVRDLAATGMLSDARTVGLMRDWIQEQIDASREKLIPAGLVRREIKRSRGAAIDRVEDLGLVKRFVNKRGAISLSKKALLECGDPALAAYQQFPDCDIDLLVETGLATVSYVRDDKAAAERMLATWPAEAQKIWKDGALGKEALEALAAHGCRLTANNGIQIDADACNFSGDDALKELGRYNKLIKTLSNDLSEKMAGGHTVEPLHANYDLLKETGRLGSSPNVMNMPRTPGIREMWVAPKGWAICEADFSAVELHTFAQICYDTLGWSKTGDALNSGIDLHLVMAASYYHIDYEEAVRRKKEPEIKQARTMGKGANFGAKGAMGPDRFVEYCWNNYGLTLTRELAVEILNLHKRICAEFPSYTNWIKSMAREPGKFGSRIDIVQPWSGRLRAGCGYCDAHNSPFQGLAADLAGVALWRIFLACYGFSELGTRDPLYGCKLWLFVHDSIAVLAPVERCHEAALRVSEVMQGAGEDVLPRCPPKAEPVVSLQLSKLAEPVWRDGRLVPWDAWEQCRIAAESDTLEKLRDVGWPEYMLRDILGPAYYPPPPQKEAA